MRRSIYDRLYPAWKSRYATGLKRRRLRIISDLAFGGMLFDPEWMRGKKVLDVGCANGKDFLQFLLPLEDVYLFGLDVRFQDYQAEQCRFIKADASAIPFDDKYFDLVVSIGMLEHIGPIEKLSQVIAEIDRVAKSFAVVVPSVSTMLEPHTVEPFWQLRDKGKKRPYSGLFYFSDETWLQFKGFASAKIRRFYYLPPLISDVVIYRSHVDFDPRG